MGGLAGIDVRSSPETVECELELEQPRGRGEALFGGKERGGRGDLTSMVTARNYSGIMAN